MRTQERFRGIYRAPLIAGRLMLQGRYDFVYDQMAIRLRGINWPKRMNLARSGLNLLYRRSRPWSMPLHMQFEFSNSCNLRCPVCPTGVGELRRPAEMMDFSLFRDTLAEVGPYLLTASLWGWGESLLHPQLGDFLREVQKYNITTLISTNGQNLDRDEVIDAIAEYPPTFLIVAVDGLTDETNSRFRVGAQLAPIHAGMRRLVEKKKQMRRTLPILQMRFIEMKHNQHELPKAEAFAASHGFDMLALRTLCPVASNRGLVAHHELTPNRADLKKMRTTHKATNHICMEPFWFPTLFSDGTLVGCDQDFNAENPLGRIGPGVKFRDLWTGSQAAAARRRIRDEPGALGFCSKCPAKHRTSTDSSYRALWLDRGRKRELVTEG